MFFRRSSNRARFSSRRTRSRAMSRGRRLTRFEALEGRQMLNATSILPSGDDGPEIDTYQTGGSSGDVIPVETISLNSVTDDLIDAIALQEVVDWLVHLDRKLTSPIELLHVSRERSGEQVGAIHVLREFQEVIVNSLEGDPDRPIVVGALFNPYQTGGSSGDVLPVDTISLNFGRIDDAAPRGNDSIWIDLGYPIQTVPEAASAELLPRYWVIGTELPRVAVNEVLAEYETLSGTYTYPDENNLFLASFRETEFTGGVVVAAGDVNGDDVADTFVRINAAPIDRDDLAG